MNVEDVMMKEPAACYPQSVLSDAVRIMWEHNCGFVPVVRSPSDASVVGVITDRDACMASYARRASLRDLRVADAMSTTPRTCLPSDSITHAKGRLAEAQVRRLPVVDEHGALVGVLSLADLAREAYVERAWGKSVAQESELGALVAAVSRPLQLRAGTAR